MGLDSLWRKEDDTDGIVPKRFKICGGLFSGNLEIGNDSFRGKVYDSLVTEVTGQSLYQDKIPADVIKQMNTKIQQAKYEEVKDLAMYELSEEEWQDFQAMWQEHSNADHHLVGWW